MGRNGALMVALAAGLVTACGGTPEPVGGVTADEAAQLNDAAEMLDASADGLAAPEGTPLDAESNSGDSSSGGNAG